MSLDLLGTHELGFDYGALFKTAGGLLEGGAAIAEGQQKEKAEAEKTEVSSSAVIAADNEAANAVARAEFGKKPADVTAAKVAVAKQDSAAAGLSPSAQQKRLEAAKATWTRVAKAAKANPKDAYQRVLVKAWQAMVNKISSGAAVESGATTDQENFLTRAVLGPVPGYGVVLGGAVLFLVLGLIIRKSTGTSVPNVQSVST